MRWTPVCSYDDLQPGRGVCVLLEGEQIAVFRIDSGEVFAIANQDPFSGAFVLSRGLVGCRGGESVVFSPMYKQAIALRSGIAIDEPAVTVDTYPIRVRDGDVEVAGAEEAVA